MKVAVVILNWNGLDLLKRFLKDVVDKSKDLATVYLADNGSEDGSIDWIKKHIPAVEIIDNSVNLGFAGGYNSALKKINAQYFVLLNSDVEVTEEWLKPMVDFLDENPNVAACQPKILSYDNKKMFEYAGAAGGFIDKYGYPYCRGRIFDRIEGDHGQYDDRRDIFWASGACMIIRSSIWTKAGGFDSDFFAHMEEIDLCWRIHNMNQRISFVPKSVVYHIGGGTLSYDSPSKVFLNFRNNLFLLHKNLPERTYKRIIFKRMVLDGVAALRFMLKFKFSSAWQIFRSHLEYHREKENLNIKRIKTTNANNYYPKHLILNKSIVFNFYLKGKKLFDENTPH